MMKLRRFLSRFAAATLAIASISTAAWAQTPAPGPTDAELRQLFDAADVNRDGAIDIDESVADVVRAFGAYDRNGDRYLTPDELPRHNPERVRRADRDGDGKLSLGEVASDRVWEFFEADTNRNGALEFTEIRVYVNKVRAGSR